MAVREVPDYQGTSVKVRTSHPQLTGIRRVGMALLQDGRILLGSGGAQEKEGREPKQVYTAFGEVAVYILTVVVDCGIASC